MKKIILSLTLMFVLSFIGISCQSDKGYSCGAEKGYDLVLEGDEFACKKPDSE
jgi:hypothetical protein